jgi:hypothetical protein
MRFLLSDTATLDIAITLVLSSIHLGTQGSNEKDKMRTTLKNLMEGFLGYEEGKFSKLKHHASGIADNTLEDSIADKLISNNYYDLKLAEMLNFSYEEPAHREEEKDVEMTETSNTNDNQASQHFSMAQQYRQMVLQPRYDETSIVFQPYFKPEYKLFFSSQLYFVFFRQLYSLYERLIKAKQIIREKVEEDLTELHGLKERADEFRREKFDLFLSGVLCAIKNNKDSMDQNKYEDFTRALFGSKAYLLFEYNKLL